MSEHHSDNDMHAYITALGDSDISIIVSAVMTLLVWV